MLNPINKKCSYIAYICTLASSSGYYGYYLKSKEHLFIWVIIFLIGIVLLGVKNNYIYKKNHSKFIYADMLYVLIICFMPSIFKWPGGLSILIMVIAGVIYGHMITQYFYK